MNQIWDEFFTKENIQLICVPGFIIAFSIFAKYMEIRQNKKDAEARKKSKNKKLAKRERGDDMEKLPPFFM
ncbi:MAG: hypothetical protein RI905_1049 [Pseudomonadota bacterium]|jgi:hypothetical protein